MRIAGTKLLAAQLVAVVAGVVLLRLKWSDVSAVVAAIDHGDVLFADFVHHYYPTVEPPLRQANPAGGFFYPAAFAVLIAPIGWLPLSIAKVVWGVLQLGCVLWAATQLTRRAAPDRPLLAILGATLTITSIPILHNLKWGQVSILILVAAAGSFIAYGRGRTNLAALLLGIAAGIKGYPLVFLGWFVLRGDLRFVFRTGAACLLTLVVLPALLMGPSHALFFQRVSTSAVLGAAEGVLRDFNSQYAPAVLSRFYRGGWDAAPLDALAWAKLGSGIVLVGIAVLVLLAARSNAPRIAVQRELLGFILIACSLPFWLRTCWSHYFVHLPVAHIFLAAVFARESRPRSALALGVLVAPSVYLSSVLGLFETRGWWYYANAGSLFFANALVLIACTAFVADAHVREGGSLINALRHRLSTMFGRFARTRARRSGPDAEDQKDRDDPEDEHGNEQGHERGRDHRVRSIKPKDPTAARRHRGRGQPLVDAGEHNACSKGHDDRGEERKPCKERVHLLPQSNANAV